MTIACIAFAIMAASIAVIHAESMRNEVPRRAYVVSVVAGILWPVLAVLLAFGILLLAWDAARALLGLDGEAK